MGTVRHKKLAPELIENLKSDKPKPIGQVLKSVGYGTGLQHNPKRVLESEGLKEELRALGFDPDAAKDVVGTILLDEEEKASDRLKAAEMIFKVHGSFAAEKHVNLNINRNEDSKLDALIAQIEDGLDQLEGTA